MNLTIKKLVIENFKGIPSLYIEFDNKDLSIYGQNGSGKTTIIDAVSWLFFNKDSHNNAKFSLKPLVGGVSESNVEHMVEGVFCVDDKEIKLKKVFKEKWTKKRGSLTPEFTGHITTYYIDEVSVGAGKFKKAVEELTGDVDRFQLLSSPTFFSENIHWKKGRDLIIGMIGDISDTDVIASDPNLEAVPGILDGKSIEDRMQMIAEGKKQANKDIESIPGRIDEKKRSLPDLKTTNTDILIKKLAELNKKLSEQNEKIATLKAGGGAAGIMTKIAEADADILNLKSSFNDQQDNAVRDKKAELNKLLDAREENERVVKNLKKDRDSIVEDIKNVEETLAKLRAEFADISKKEFTEDTCPSCGQTLPFDSLDEARAKFNVDKSSRIERNRSTGKSNAAKLKELKSDLERVNADLDRLSVPPVSNEKIESLEAEIAAAKPETPFEETESYIEATSRKVDLLDQLKDIESFNSEAIAKETEAKEATEEDIKEQNYLLSQIEQHQRDTDRINELLEQEKKLGQQYTELSGQQFVLESFIRAKVSLLESKVSEKFGDSVGFKMFSEQINGGLTETCEVTVDGVPYADLNSAKKVQSGLSIINVFSAHYKFSPFIFIDNRESVTEIPETSAQVISLFVSPQDKQLRIESCESAQQKIAA